MLSLTEFGGTVCGLHVEGEPERLGEPTIPYGCTLMDEGRVFDLAEPNAVKGAGARMVVKAIKCYLFDEVTSQWVFSDRIRGNRVVAIYEGKPVKYVLEWQPCGLAIIVR